ncbi:UNVERIFIED_CONTAM: hypothetical protein NY603_17520, partial [Bacteroidetes bacterium 56_B9]
ICDASNRQGFQLSSYCASSITSSETARAVVIKTCVELFAQSSSYIGRNMQGERLSPAAVLEHLLQ